MKRTVGILMLAAIVGSPGGPMATGHASTLVAGQPETAAVETSAPPADDQAIAWKTPHVDLRADAVRLRIGDTLLSPPSDARVQEWPRDGSHVELRVRWSDDEGMHEVYLGLEPSEERWVIADASYLQVAPEVREPGAPQSPIEFAIQTEGTSGSAPGASDAIDLRATATTPVVACDGASAAAVEADLQLFGLSLAVAPPQHDLLDIARALLGQGPRPPGDWLGQEGVDGPQVTVACTPPIAATLEDETIALSRPHDTDEEALAGLATVEVSPGVFRVSSDGIRDLSSEPLVSCESLAMSLDAPGLDLGPLGIDESSLGRVVAGLDGDIWLFWGDRFVRLGDETTHRWTDGQLPTDRDDLEVAPDGTLWQAPSWGSSARRRAERLVENLDRLRSRPEAFAARPDCLTDSDWLTGPDGALRVYREGEWQVALDSPSHPVRQVEIASDDSIWALWSELAIDGRYAPQAARLGADGWRLAALPEVPLRFPETFATLEDGSLMMQARGRSVALWRLDGTPGPEPGRWQPVESRRGLGDVVVSPGGIAWGKLTPNTVARLDGEGWQEWDLGEATDPDAPRFLGGGGPLAAGQDGSLWLQARPTRTAQGCHGVYRFDGTTWSHFLDGQCVHSIDVAPNGWVWLRAASDLGDEEEGPVDLYAIRPDAPGA